MKINQNTGFGTHNTSKRTGKIQYIVIHYIGATGDAKANINYYNQPTVTNASADFYVGHSGDIWQYNPNPEARYCWAVGGKKQSSYGGSLYGKAKNSNCISIEMCVKTKGGKTANSPDWYFTKQTIASTIELTKYLMNKYGITSDRVIRHFDVNGKYCPGVVGWNSASGSEKEWESFKSKLGGASTIKPTTTTNTTAFKPYLVKVIADALNVRKGAGTLYKVTTVIKKNEVYTIVAEKNGWGRLKSGAGWISLKYTKKC